jgi:hypothetical protein
MALTQAESFEPFWRAHRDNWRACTPADVWGLREDRTFEPPSKAHTRRLTRTRPVVTAAKPEILHGSTRADDLAKRIALGKSVLAACRCLPTVRKAEPLPYVRPAPIPPSECKPAKPADPDGAWKALERKSIIAQSRMVYTEWKVDTIAKVLRIMWAFGSAEAYYAATRRD